MYRFTRRCLLVAAALAVAVVPMPVTPASASRPSIGELIQSDPDLSILAEAIDRAGLGGALGEGPFTVFAPTNQAFADLLDDLDASSLDDIPADVLTEVLLDHVVEGFFTRDHFAFLDDFDGTLTPLGGLALAFDIDPLEVNDIGIITADLGASNGVVHIVEGVLIEPDPRPSITELAVATPQLSLLVEAVTRTGLDKILDITGPFTVFAPTNEAFVRLLDEQGLSSLDDIEDGPLVEILFDHIIFHEIDARELRRNQAIATIGGLQLVFRAGTVNGIPIVAADVEGFNGTVHLIDGVLLEQ